MLTNKGIRGLLKDRGTRGLLGMGSFMVLLFAFIVRLAIEGDLINIGTGVVMETVTFWVASVIMVASMTCITVLTAIEILED